jgi:6-O-methylguanine DNA methyltransferase, DNA binding domain
VHWVIDWALLESSGAPALRSTESIPYAGPLLHRPRQRRLGSRPRPDHGANPIPIVAPCHRVTRGVEIPTTFVGGSERRHWLENHETTGKDAPPD